MDWQQKLAAIQAFAGAARVALRMRSPDDWYVDAGMSIGGNGMLEGSYGFGPDPEAAVGSHWRIYSELPPARYAVTGYGPNERRARWNGFMWETLTDEQCAAIHEDNRASA